MRPPRPDHIENTKETCHNIHSASTPAADQRAAHLENEDEVHRMDVTIAVSEMMYDWCTESSPRGESASASPQASRVRTRETQSSKGSHGIVSEQTRHRHFEQCTLQQQTKAHATVKELVPERAHHAADHGRHTSRVDVFNTL
ncbi:hypothetical protein OPT61_g10463 [Boeremia exigua]|uniref:Uncharacterized protein n=1 Tax=Boeremia exigua TaxID=749465 RepID=A0ACC2HPJ2_9PLEO|nr:hypothetical protein OPT61_g10463 [Boeremia exigua]